MCNGTIMDKLISFSLPLMLSGILQLMFNAVDIVVVGRFSGSEALAAVGSTTALINVFTNLFIGISLGANVLAARFYAAGKDRRNVRNSTYIDPAGSDQRDHHGSSGSNLCQNLPGADGYAGGCDRSFYSLYAYLFSGNAVFYAV